MVSPSGFTVEVMGPTTVRDSHGQSVRLAPRERAVLCRLALAAPREVTAGQLIDALWGDQPPATARKTLQTYIRSIRKRCGEDIVATGPQGYRLGPTARSGVDVVEELLRRVPGKEPDRDTLLARIEATWSGGEPLADLQDTPDLQVERHRLRRLARQALLAVGRCRVEEGQSVAAERVAERLVDEDPYDETAWQVLLDSLLAQGRRAEVTSRYLQAHRRLAEVGLQPGPGLQQVHADSLGGGMEQRVGLARRQMRLRPATPLIGREDDLSGVEALLDGHPVVTITGPGGVGKTRLALEVLDRADAEPAAVADLSATTDTDELMVALAGALDAAPGPGEDLSQAVIERLGAADGLVLLDCADLVHAALARLLATVDLSPKTRLLVTSRRRLGIPEEALWRLAPLATAVDAAGPSTAYLLLRDLADRVQADRVRAAGVQPDAEDEVLQAIARQLDGLPLALELAAARLATVPARTVLDELDDRLALADPSHSRPARHRTLGAALDWTYDRLEDTERRALGMLSLLPAGAEPRLLAELGMFEPTVGLTEASMAYLDVDAGRYRLWDTVQQLGRETAVPLLDEWLLDRVLQSQIDLAAQLDDRLRSPEEGRAAVDTARELPNLRAAFEGLGRRGRERDQIMLAARLVTFVTWRSRPDVSAWVAPMIEQATAADTAGFCRATGVSCWAAYVEGDSERLISWAQRALDACPPEHAWEAAELGSMIAHAVAADGDMDRARRHLQEAEVLARATNNAYASAMNLGAMTLYGALSPELPPDLDDTAAAARDVAQQTGVPSLLAWTWYATGMWHLRNDRTAAALTALEESLAMAEESGARTIEAIARRTWIAISPTLSAEEVLASHLRTLSRLRAGGQQRPALGLLPWLVAPLADLGRHRQVLAVERVLRRYGRGNRVSHAPGYAGGVRRARAALGPTAEALLARPVASLARELDRLCEKLGAEG